MEKGITVTVMDNLKQFVALTPLKARRRRKYL